VYFTCKINNLPIRTGMKLWLKLKQETVDPLYAQYKSNTMRFLSKADNALTKMCKKNRVYSENQFNFVKALIEGGCNCSCGTQMLLSLKEAYGLTSVGFALFPGHINIVHRGQDDKFMVYETTTFNIKEWIKIEDYVEDKTLELKGHTPGMMYTTTLKKQKLNALEFETSAMLLYPFLDFFSHNLEKSTRNNIVKEVFADTPKKFWSSVPLLESLWDFTRLNPVIQKLSSEQKAILLKLKEFYKRERRDPWQDQAALLVFEFTPGISPSLFSLTMEMLRSSDKARKNHTNSIQQSLDNFLKFGSATIGTEEFETE
jgi:hypothetical protein